MRCSGNIIVTENLEFHRAFNLEGKAEFYVRLQEEKTKKMTKKLYKVGDPC